MVYISYPASSIHVGVSVSCRMCSVTHSTRASIPVSRRYSRIFIHLISVNRLMFKRPTVNFSVSSLACSTSSAWQIFHHLYSKTPGQHISVFSDDKCWRLVAWNVFCFVLSDGQRSGYLFRLYLQLPHAGCVFWEELKRA